MKFSVAAAESVLEEHRKHTAVRDFATSYDPAEITADHQQVETVSGFQVDDRPLLFFTPDFAEVVIDAAIFPEGLHVVRVTCLGDGDSGTCGRIEPEAFRKLGATEVTQFLIRSHAIETWVHLGADLEIVSETELPMAGVSTITVSGEHRYFTNEEVVEPVNFTVRFDAKGRIDVIGVKP
ncbi:MAG: hypothetical protein HKN23_20320 [Verrucomicrobiales bacterium]|nr:hypothetical protein [Verrucomicrobiales bacterium]